MAVNVLKVNCPHTSNTLKPNIFLKTSLPKSHNSCSLLWIIQIKCYPTWSYSVGMCAEHNAMDLHHYCHHNHCRHHTASMVQHRYLSSHTWDDLKGKLCFEDSDRESRLMSHYPYSHLRHCRPENLQTNQTCFTAVKLRNKLALCLMSLSINRSYEALICYICFSRQNHPHQHWFPKSRKNITGTIFTMSI